MKKVDLMGAPISPLVFSGALVVVGLAFLAAAWSDVRRYTIPNSICATVALAYVAALLVMPPSTWFMGVATGIIVLMVGAVLFTQRWVGGGDVKLAAAAALWAGPALFSGWVMVTSIAGAVLATALLVTPLRRILASHAEAETGFNQPMPFGVALAVGGLWVVGQQFTLV